MPAPAAAQLKKPIEDLLRDQGLEGQRIPALADALSESIAAALMQFTMMMKVAPGIPVPPPAGPSAAPGKLM